MQLTAHTETRALSRGSPIPNDRIVRKQSLNDLINRCRLFESDCGPSIVIRVGFIHNLHGPLVPCWLRDSEGKAYLEDADGKLPFMAILILDRF